MPTSAQAKPSARPEDAGRGALAISEADIGAASAEGVGEPEAVARVHREVAAFVDEAGLGGYVRNLNEETDTHICVFAALVFPEEFVERARRDLEPMFEAFRAAAPPGSKYHITDAFKVGNESWGVVATAARSKVFDYLIRHRAQVLYVARSGRIARKIHLMEEELAAAARAQSDKLGPAIYHVPGRNRPVDDKVEDRVFADLALMLDLFATSHGRGLVSFYFDQIEAEHANRYMKIISRLKSISKRRREFKVRHKGTGAIEKRVIETEFKDDFPMDAISLGSCFVVGKADPLVFAADLVANSLWRHLTTLGQGAPLNDATTLRGWVLEPITFYDRSGAPSSLDRY